PDPAHYTVSLHAALPISYTPAANYHGADSFTYTVTDAAAGESATQTVSITVTAVTDLTANDDSFSTSEDTPLSDSVAINDTTTSGGTLSFAKTTDPSHGNVTANADGTFTYTPAANYHGTDSFTYTVTDAAAVPSTTHTGSITVTAVTDLTGHDDSFSTSEDTVLSDSVATNDTTTSGGTLSFAKTTDPSHGNVTVNADGSFTYTPAANYHGADSFTYTVTDAAAGESATQTVSITVTAVTDLTGQDDSFSTSEDTVLSDSVAINDTTTSGGTLSFAKTTDPSHGSVTVNADGSFTYTPAANYHRADS